MKLTVIVLLAACLQLAARSNGQTVSLSVKNVSLKHVFREIQKQTGLNILVEEQLLEKAGKVTLKVQNMPVNEVLAICLRNQQVSYIIDGGSIVVKSKPAEEIILPENSLPPPIEIRGTITDETGKPLPDASVKLKGTEKGTTTDANGNFELQVPDAKSVLIISYVGFEAMETPVSKSGMVKIALKRSDARIEEVILVGYSNKKRSELTSAVTVISSEKLKDVTANNIGTMLQGKVPGLQIVNSVGSPGAEPEIRLRGISSVHATQSPLFVVDGIIGGNYDPNDVETVTVLKDAGATAMYGSQANAGVIIITTKKAITNKTRFDVKFVNGFRVPDFGEMKMMNGSQLYNYQKEFYRDYNPSAMDNSYKIDILKFYGERPRTLAGFNNNWLTTVFKPAYIQNSYFSASGKTEKADYYLGLSFYNENGTLLQTKYQRVNLRANSTYRFNNKISLTNNINLSGSIGKGYSTMDISYAYLNLPWDSPFDSLGNAKYVDGNSNFKWWSRDKINPVHTIHNSDYPYKGFDINYDANLNITFTNWLSFSSTNRLSAGYNKSTSFHSPVVAGHYHGTGYLSEYSSMSYGVISNNLLKFNLLKGDHSINGLAGMAFETRRAEILGGSGRGLPLGLSVLDVVSNNILVNGYNDRYAIQSYISQLNYSYLNKYYVTGSYRIDGSSAFPSNKRYASFPSLSAAWQASNESFFGSKRVVNNLRFRASYGITGTQDIGASRYLGLYSLTSQYNSQTAATPLQLPNPHLTWESKYQVNAGVDIGLFKRINLSVDVYNNVTKNLLLQVSQPLSVGFEQRWENVGEIMNKGIEIGLNSTNIKARDFQWTTDFSINFNKNKLRKLPSDIIRTGAWAISQIYRNDGNLYEFYMPKWMGVNPQTGAPMWEKITKDGQGNVTGKIATSDYASATFQESGSALPKFQGGITNRFQYKKLSLSVNAYFLSGNKVFSNQLRFVMNDGSEPYLNQVVLPAGYNIWSKPGDIASNPSPQNSANSTETSTRFLKDGSYLSIRNITMAYELPVSWVWRLKLDDVIVSLSADNVYTFTKFLGQDAQTTITPGAYVTPGVSDFKYPNNRQFLFNINFRF